MNGLVERKALLLEIAAKVGTPVYVYALDEVRQAASALQAELPNGTRFYYSLKANAHPAIVRELAQAGLRMEICSSGELDQAVRAGVDPGRCLYTGPAKTLAEMAQAIRRGVRLFSVESSADRARLEEAATATGSEVDYLVRINAGTATNATGLRMTGTATQFGVDLADRETLGALLKSQGATRAVGMHFFSASNIPDKPSQLTEFTHNLRTAIRIADEFGIRLEVLDLGGGFPAPYAGPDRIRNAQSDPGELTDLLDRELVGWRDQDPVVAFEAGRALSGTCGVLLSTVMDVKTAGDRLFVVLDAGINSLGGMSGLGRLLAPAARPTSLSTAATADEAVEMTLTGPLCTPLDVHNRRLSMAVPEIGNVLAVPNVGAYGLTASLMGFLARPIAAEVIVDGEHMISARRLSLTEMEL